MCSRLAWNLIALAAFGFYSAAVLPVRAGEAESCNTAKANGFIAAGDRLDVHRQYAEASRWYLAASRNTRGCRTAAEVLVGVRSLAKAGSALAQSGEYLEALSLLRAAQARLLPVEAGDIRAGAGEVQSTNAVRTLADQVQTLISAIDRVAQSTM